MAAPGLVQFRAIVPSVIGMPDPTNAAEAIRRTQVGAQAIAKVAATYPPPLPSRYVRTGRLGRGWQVRNLMNGATVENRVLYAIYVQGDWQTAEMMRRHWRTIEEIGQRIWDERILPEVTDLMSRTKPL